MKERKKVVVVGGGTAGMITALWAHKHLPDIDLTVIKSSQVPIVGVGEASTPSMVSFLEEVGIDPLELIKRTGGTIKNGITFKNWNGDGDSYFHGFSPTGGLGEILEESCSCPPHFATGVYSYYERMAIHKGVRLDNVMYSSMLAASNKVDIDNSSWSLQFEASKVAAYLQEVAESRGILVKEGMYESTIDDKEGFIKALVLKGGSTLPLDFLFDCSGFSRLFIGGKFAQKWESYQEHLPMKQAIPFRLPKQHPLTSCTTATAMKYGWMWSIPLQDLTGCGYVYDSDYINAEEAQREVEEVLGHTVTVPKVLDFAIGHYENVWVKNCVAIGLSTGFAEPLEATSIHRSIDQLSFLTHYINHLFQHNSRSTQSYNTTNFNQNRSVLDFIYLHYITKREDSDFWKNFQIDNPVPESLKNILALLKERNLRFIDIEVSNIWELSNYLQVSEGLGVAKGPISIEGYEGLSPSLEERTKLFERYARDALDHAEFLERLGE
jgi:tryptophan 7-halogenase